MAVTLETDGAGFYSIFHRATTAPTRWRTPNSRTAFPQEKTIPRDGRGNVIREIADFHDNGDVHVFYKVRRDKLLHSVFRGNSSTGNGRTSLNYRSVARIGVGVVLTPLTAPPDSVHVQFSRVPPL